ncbi:MAG: DnaJ domain-containing protein [Stigonema ocellatum SAG 48.90 = DSM 106950]|nr:DnaJ domain-containing protein [Stigonema ocellatum SAG 48.90 = DSM 106950]
MVYELYQMLEISPQASADEIKRAYFRLVRKYSPEKDPERFKQIRGAYNTLYDPTARQNYDSQQQYGDQITALINQAQEKMNVEEWSSAISLLKQVLLLAPAADGARNLLGLCHIHLENWDFAVKVYRALTKTNPEVPIYWSNFGHVYKQQAESLKDEDYSELAQLYHNARECFQRTIKLESFNSEPYLEIARTYLEERNYSQAIAWAESAIGADGKADVDDFEALFFICRVYLVSGESYKIEPTAQRIASLLPEREDAQKYAAERFAGMGLEVAKIGAKYADVGLLTAAIEFLDVARNFDPCDPDIREIYERVEDMLAPLNEYELLKDDSLIIQGLQKLAAFCLADFFSLHHSEQERKSYLDEIIAEIFANSNRNIFPSIRRIKSHYPSVYGLNKDLFNRIEQAA